MGKGMDIKVDKNIYFYHEGKNYLIRIKIILWIMRLLGLVKLQKAEVSK